MTTRENLITALNGDVPDITPLSFYSWMAEDFLTDDWKRLYDLGKWRMMSKKRAPKRNVAPRLT